MELVSGASYSSLTISSGGALEIAFGYTLSGYAVSSGVSLDISSGGGAASGAIVSSGGTETIAAGSSSFGDGGGGARRSAKFSLGASTPESDGVRRRPSNHRKRPGPGARRLGSPGRP